MENQEKDTVDTLIRATVIAERKRIAEKARDRVKSFKSRGLNRDLIAALALNDFANSIDPETAQSLKIRVSNQPTDP